MQLRDYQIKLTDDVIRKLSKRKVIAQLATGGGKTVCFSSITKRYIDKHEKSVLILVHRKELLQQTRRSLHNAFNLDCQIIIAGMKTIPYNRIYVGMVETVKRRIDQLHNIGMIIIDEAHIANFNLIHNHFPESYFIGFTATPLAAAKDKPLKNYYNDIVCGIDIADLIKIGSLCANETYAAKDSVNRKELSIKAGEFDNNLMGLEFSQPQHVKNVVKIYKEKAEGTKAIVFNVNIEHSLKVTDAFKEAGYNCRHFDGETDSNERTEVLSWFENTPGAILCNVGIATTGFDEPTIETVIVNRSTMSMPLWLQMTGRGSRPTEFKKTFTIIDMGGNAITHGDWCDRHNWDYLFWNPPKKGEGVAPVKDCPKCMRILHAKVMICPECGHEFPPPKQKVEEELSEFVLVTKNINVLDIIYECRFNQEYRPFFKLAESFARELKYTTKELNQEKFIFTLHILEDKHREWCRLVGKKYDQWHQNLTRTKLIEELKNYYKTWEPL
ncbi:MAG: DEAD/DEAH box helicase family protein [Dolichospermum sp.]|jgi:superfamily II DNA or RNA helicase